MERDVILGLAFGYDEEALRPFFDSLAATGFAGEVVLFTSHLAPSTLDRLRARRVRTIPYRAFDPESVPRRWRRARRFLLRWKRRFPSLYFPGQEAIVQRTWDCRAVRYSLFARFLRAEAGRIRNVLLTDVRDVVFQADPFVESPAAPVCSFEEHPATPLLEQNWNRWWVRGLYGKAVLDAMARETILCSGVTLGTRRGVLAYLDVMRRELRLRVDLNGFDQGAHNVLARRGRLPGLEIVPWNRGPVMHLGIAPRAEIATSARGLVLTAAGEPAAVVHQYDRHPDLARRLLARWR